MEASAEVGGNPGKLLPKAGEASCDDVVATGLQLNGGRRLLGKDMGVPPSEHPKEGTSKSFQKCLVPHHILTVPAKDNNARGSQLCMHTGTFLYCI